MCKCKDFGALVETSNSYNAFTEDLELISYGNWIKLMKCSICSQLWVVEEWDKYQAVHAVKISSDLNWESFDYSQQIKEKMIENRGGLGTNRCVHAGCSNMQVKASAYCIHHLYETGERT
jgi:hypothetical protein